MRQKVLFLWGLAAFVLMISRPGQAVNDTSPVNFLVKLTRDSLYVGDEFTLSITADYPDEFRLSEPPVSALSRSFVLKDGPQLKTKTSKGRRYDEYALKLAPFETGLLEIPSLEFLWYDALGNQHPVNSPAAEVYVKTSLPADTAGIQIRDIVGPRPLPPLWWPYAIALAVLAALGGGGYVYYRRRIRSGEPPKAPPEPPYEAAIRRLIKLRLENPLSRGLAKEYYVELSDILRHYVQGRFKIVAVEATTFELKRRLRHPELPGDKATIIIDFLNRSDMVKFAKHIPALDISEHDYEVVKDVIVSTRPIVVAAEKPAAVGVPA